MRPSPVAILRPSAAHGLALSHVDPGRCPVSAYLASLSTGSRKAVRGHLDNAASVLTDGAVTDATRIDWSLVRYEHTVRVVGVWREKYLPAGARARVAVLRALVKTAWRLGLLSAEDYMRAVDLPVIKARPLPVGRALTVAELTALLDVCTRDPSIAGRRDAAILAVFLSGMRVGELVRLDLASATADGLVIRRGKGGSPRRAYTPHQRLLDEWIAARGSAPGPLFLSLSRGVLGAAYMTTEGITQICKRRAAEAGVDAFTPHDLRRTVATRLRERGVAIDDIQQVLGHLNISTTQVYFRHDVEAAKRRAIAMLAEG